MILRYAHPDGVPRVWDLSTVRFLTSEAEAMERTTSIEWADLSHRRLLVVKASPTARRAMVWALLKRAEPTLRYSACDPAIDDMDVKLGADDITELRAEAEAELAKGNITEAEFDEGMADLDGLTDRDVLAAAAAPESGPKAEPLPEAGDPVWDSAPTASPISV